MLRVIAFAVTMLVGLACSEAPQLQTVRFQKLAMFQVPQAWELHGEVDGEIGYVHRELPGVEMWVAGGVEELGSAVTNQHIKSLIGREVNMKHGGAVSRLSMAGNAVVRYQTEAEEQGGADAVRWIVAKPYGLGMLRLDVSIEYVPGAVPQSDVDALVAGFDPSVSDATFGSQS